MAGRGTGGTSLGRALAAGLACAAVLGVSSASALPSNCQQSSSTVTCSYGYTGSEQTFDVPDGVTSVTISAVGGYGGWNSVPTAGTASATVTVTPGSTLYVEVGGHGAVGPLDGLLDDPGIPGWNGGGAGGFAGGGGASDVRNVSCASSCASGGGASSLASRLLVAGGGGGGGSPGIYAGQTSALYGGDGGSPGVAGGDGDNQGQGGISGGGGGGGGGTAGAGGGAGAAGTGGNADGQGGTAGTLGAGGTGAVVATTSNGTQAGGSGGGGGYYGGGGGGSGVDYGNCGFTWPTCYTPGGGGGGGSSYAPGGTTGTAGAWNTPSSVTISYTLPPEAPQITSATNTTFSAGADGSFVVTTTGVPTPALQETGSLPGGVTFSDNGDGTATLAGTPTSDELGTYPISIGASNGVAPDASQDFTLTVNGSPAITSADHVSFPVGVAGTFQVAATGLPTPALSETGTLPDGVSFVDNGDGTATLSGTPAGGTAGSYPLTIKSANGVSPDASQDFTLTISSGPAITSANHASFGKGVLSTFTVTTTGVPTPALSETGALPTGVTFTDNGDGTAKLAGTPAVGGSFPLTIHATNGVLPDGSQSFTLTVQSGSSVLHVSSLSPAAAVAGTKVSLLGTGLAGVTEVDFNGASLPAAIVSDTATKLVVTVPADATVGAITVHGAIGTVTTPSFKPIPKITSLSAVDGDVGNEITITGTNLTAPQGVKFGTVPTSAGLTLTPALTLRAIVPASGFSSGKVTVITPGGTAVSTQTFTVTKVTGFSPASAAAGQTVTITGQGLGSATAVDFFGHNGVTPTSVSATSVKAVVPNDAMPGVLIVHTPNTADDEPSMTSAKALKVVPTITNVTPLDGVAGTPVTITGTGFFANLNTVVKFGTVVLDTYTVMSPTEIDVTIPGGFSSGPVTVTTPGGGTAVSKQTVQVTSIKSFAPAKGVMGATITITGQGLASTTAVNFSGPTFMGLTIPAAGTIVGTPTATSVKVTVPALAMVGPITVVTPRTGLGGIHTAGDFTPLPSLTGIAPAPALANGIVIVSGANLEPTGVAPTATLGSESILVSAPNQGGFFTTLPPDAITGQTLTVTTPTGTASVKVTVAPTISAGPTPSHAAAGAPVTLQGLTFTGTTKVTFNGGVSVPFKVTGALGTTQTLTFNVPAGATTGAITVTNAGGAAQSPSFTVDPVVTSFTPTTGPVGTTLTVKGTGFYGATFVKFAGGVSASPTAVTPTSLKVVVPDGVDSGPIVVHTDSAGDSAASGASFVPTASLASFSPAGGVTGTTVTIHGFGFTNVTAVKFGSTPQTTFTVNSPNQITVAVPDGAGDGKITVVRNGSLASLVSSGSFSILSVSNVSATTNVHVTDTITITGTHLGNTTKVTFPPGVDATPTSVTSTSVQVVVPDNIGDSGSLTVTTSDFGTVATPSVTFAPEIQSISVTNTASGSILQILGPRFDKGTPTVSIAGTPVAADKILQVKPAEIDLDIPDGSGGGAIVVSNDAGTSIESFTVYKHDNGLGQAFYDNHALSLWLGSQAIGAAAVWGETTESFIQCSGEDALQASNGSDYATWVYGTGSLQGYVVVAGTATCPTTSDSPWN